MKKSKLILTLNSGSSSLKFGQYRIDPTGVQQLFSETLSADATLGHDDAMHRLVRALDSAGMEPPDAVGHRVVHGGPVLRQHGLIDEDVLRHLQAAAAFAPLHTPATLALIRWAQQHFRGVPQVACFDTQFYADLPDLARVLPVDKTLGSAGLQRYGFHGLSVESIVRQLGAALPRRTVVAHLGSGVSITALQSGRSVDTSMGLTPSGGAMMATRSGDLDPGVLLYLLREKRFDAAALEALVNHRSGLVGVSGLSGDLRQLHRAAATHADARLAIEMFCMSVRKQVAAMAAVLGGLDLLVFTGGIGENDAHVRDEICRGLAWLGLKPDASRHGTKTDAANQPAAECQVLVLSSREDEQIARHVWALLS